MNGNTVTDGYVPCDRRGEMTLEPKKVGGSAADGWPLAQLSGKCEVILSALSTDYTNRFILGVESRRRVTDSRWERPCEFALGLCEGRRQRLVGVWPTSDRRIR